MLSSAFLLLLSLSLKLYLPYQGEERVPCEKAQTFWALVPEYLIPCSWLVVALIWDVHLGLGLCLEYMLVSPAKQQSAPPRLAHSPQRASQKASQAPRAWAFLPPEHDAWFKSTPRTNICIGFDPFWMTMWTVSYWDFTQQPIPRTWFSLFLPTAQLESWGLLTLSGETSS